MCTQCEQLHTPLKITRPRELEAIADRADQLVRAGLLQLTKDASWSSDFVHKFYRCCDCHAEFELVCETYHGSGGYWKKL